MIGDCDNCGHSAMYHVPLLGCVKCSCGEFHVRRVALFLFVALVLIGCTVGLR